MNDFYTYITGPLKKKEIEDIITIVSQNSLLHYQNFDEQAQTLILSTRGVLGVKKAYDKYKEFFNFKLEDLNEMYWNNIENQKRNK